MTTLIYLENTYFKEIEATLIEVGKKAMGSKDGCSF